MIEDWIKVPEEMLKAVHAASEADTTFFDDGDAQPILKAALRWLYDKLDSLERKPYNDVLAHAYNTCIGDVRRMFRAPNSLPEDGTVEFLAGTTRPVAVWWQGNRHRVVTFAEPDPPQDKDLADRIFEAVGPLGYTPTHAELDKIWDHIFRAGHGWTPPETRGVEQDDRLHTRLR